MKKLIIANWKTYLTIERAIALSSGIPAESNIIIAPAMIHLARLAQKFPNIKFASQDISSITNDYGAYTGETSGAMLQDIGVKHAIIGHSERRSSRLDDGNSISAKLKTCISKSITPIVCIGETLEDRKSKIHLDVLANQIKEIFNNLGKIKTDIIIAYEPFWSVGTGVLPSSKEITEVIEVVRNAVKFVDNRLFLVYGGSVSTENAYNLINLDGLDGLLIGKASTEIELLKSMLKILK